MDERIKFISEHLKGIYSHSQLCRRYGISRVTGYKWLVRYHESGGLGLVDRSRAPSTHPNEIPDGIVSAVLSVRHRFPYWGPRKIRAWLTNHHPGSVWPAASTIGNILHRHGLTVPRRRRRRSPVYRSPFLACDSPNAVWSADFKGWFCTGNGQRCDPLTITDNYSRYLLRCQALDRTDVRHVQPLFAAAFREYGLPVAIRTDNGVPFATTTVGGLSRLSIWWLRLGIRPERIEPGQPAQNGRHERMHRTLKQQTAQPPRATHRAQQRAFDRFQQEYNHDRPHDGIGMKTPDRLYHSSSRPYPDRLPEIVYPDNYLLRIVHGQGDIRWKNRQIYLSQTLAGEVVGFKPIDSERYHIYFGPVMLATLDTKLYKITKLTKTIWINENNKL